MGDDNSQLLELKYKMLVGLGQATGMTYPALRNRRENKESIWSCMKKLAKIGRLRSIKTQPEKEIENRMKMIATAIR